jgi:Zn-dependent protease
MLSIFEGFIQDIPIYLLSLPVLLMAFSVHETAHGYAALRLGDPTARNLGRLTLNPIKHIDLLGFISMMLFHVGWAKPVPINSRNFKNPRRDMAITGAAGPLSNLALALIHLIVLRVAMIFIASSVGSETVGFINAYFSNKPFTGTFGYTLFALAVYLLYLGVVMNISLAIFNLIPIPPFDGSRIFYAFLPPKWYFGIMKYEQIIMIVFLVLFAFGFMTGPLSWLLNTILSGLFFVVGFNGTEEYAVLSWLLKYVEQLLVFPL